MSQLQQKATSPFLCLFVLLMLLVDWMTPAHIGKGHLLRLISSKNNLTDTSRNNVLPTIWSSLGPVKVTHKIKYHTLLRE